MKPWRPSSAIRCRLWIAALALLALPLSLMRARESFSEPADASEGTSLAPLTAFRFEPGERRLVGGSGTEKGSAASCMGQFPADEVIGDFTAGAVFYQNACYTDGRYNYREYGFSLGRLLGSDGSSYEAVQVEEPKHKTVKFLASHHFLFYRVNEAVDHLVYVYDRGMVRRIGQLSGNTLHAGQFVRVPGADLSLITGSAIFVIVRGQGLTAYHPINAMTEGARILDTPWGPFEKRRLRLSGRPFDTATDYTDGPATHANTYGIHRQFFFLPGPNNTASILYQDKTTGKINLVRLDAQLQGLGEQTLTASPGEVLASATSDPEGQIYLLRISTGKGDGRIARLQKFSPDGRLLHEKQYDTSRQGLNIHAYSDGLLKAPAVSSMAWSDGTIGVILARTMHRSPDGLNHQGAIALTFDAASLALVKNHGQTSGHSFGNFLLAAQDGFVGIDLGDNYPRGVHLHRFDRTQRSSRVVFSFKTEHGSSPRNSANREFAEYTEISTPGKRFYRWSNDNRTYTELGGIAETEKGYLILFSTELPSLQNARTGESLNDARNLVVVHVRRDFEAVPQQGSRVVDELMLLRSAPVEGRFYDFGGRLNEQRNTGFVPLTSYSSIEENASRPKLLRIAPNRNLALFEVWTQTSYRTTRMLEFNDSGNVSRSLDLGPICRLGRQDDIYLHRGRLISLSGSSADQMVEINSLTLTK